MADLAAFHAWMADFASVVADRADELTELDRVIGDADHGSNMARGTAAVAALGQEDFGSIEAYVKKVGMTLVSTVGGASGPLYGTFFLRMAGPLAEVKDAGTAELGEALKAGVQGVLARGKAELGDKTMYDAWLPALEAYGKSADQGGEVGAALQAAAQGAAEGRDATIDLVARKGRASYLGERSKGHQDPGATSTTLLLESAARSLA